MKENGCDLNEALSRHFHIGSEEVHVECTVRLVVLRNEIGSQYLPGRKQGCSTYRQEKRSCLSVYLKLSCPKLLKEPQLNFMLGVNTKVGYLYSIMACIS